MERERYGNTPRSPSAGSTPLLCGRWGGGWRGALLLLVILALGLGLRSFHLGADPPLKLSWSQAPITDGARVVESARNKILLGTWITDPDNPALAHYPLSNVLSYLLFRVAGVGIWQAGFLSVLCGTVSLLLMALMLLRWAPPPAAVFGTLLMATNYQLVMYDRLPMSEALMICLMVAAMAVLVEALGRPRGRVGLLLASGVLVGLAAFWVKLHALILLPVGGSAILIARTGGAGERGCGGDESEGSSVDASRGGSGDEEGQPVGWRGLVPFGGGVLLTGLAWFIIFYLTHPSAMERFLEANVLGHYHYSAGTEGGEILTSLKRFLRKRVQGLFAFGANVTFLYRTAVPALIALLLLFRFCTNVRWLGVGMFARRLRRTSTPAVVLTLWLGLGIFALSLLDYRPLRYHIMLLPPICALAGLGLAEFLVGTGRWRPPRIGAWLVVLLLLAGFFLGYEIVGEGGRLLVFHRRKIYDFLTSLRLDADDIMNAVGSLTQRFAKPTITAAIIGVAAAVLCILIAEGFRRRKGLAWRIIVAWIIGGVVAAVPVVLAERFRRRGGLFISAGWREALVLFLLSASVAIDLGQYMPWAVKPRYTLQEVGRDMGEILSSGATVMGSAATTLCLENDLRTVPIYGDLIVRDRPEQLARYPVTHLLYRGSRLRPFVEKNLPEVLRGGEDVKGQVFVRSYTVAGETAELWRVPGWPGAAEVGYQPSHFEEGLALMVAGKAEEAARRLERFLVEFPRNGNACIVLGACYSELGREEETLALFERAVRLRPNDPVAFEDLGDLYVAHGRETEAEEAWVRALELNPRNDELHRRLAQLRGYGLEGFMIEGREEEVPEEEWEQSIFHEADQR